MSPALLLAPAGTHAVHVVLTPEPAVRLVAPAPTPLPRAVPLDRPRPVPCGCGGFTTHDWTGLLEAPDLVWVDCLGCGAEGPRLPAGQDYEAVRRWNAGERAVDRRAAAAPGANTTET